MIPVADDMAAGIALTFETQDRGSLNPVINLTGTVLHTNLGRAPLPDEAVARIRDVAGSTDLEFDLEAGTRGERDSHVEALLCELTGAEAVTVVNNNAAAVLLCLNTLAAGREVCISRGELVEIGGSFRIPEVMEKSGCRLREVGATNRTHLRDYEQATGPETGLLMKVHTSNYEIRGFTSEVSYRDLAAFAHDRELPMLADLGSGTLVNLEDYGLVHEPTVQEVLTAGADVVTFSGDKLLGGPQAGLIAGRRSFVEAIRKNPLKRALRVDKLILAALIETLKLYREPERLALRLPTLRHLSRTVTGMQPLADALLPPFRDRLRDHATVSIESCRSQIGSGALPLDQLPSLAIVIAPSGGSDAALQRLAAAFRALPVPIVGRINDGRLFFDLRTLDDPAPVTEQLPLLDLG